MHMAFSPPTFLFLKPQGCTSISLQEVLGKGFWNE